MDNESTKTSGEAANAKVLLDPAQVRRLLEEGRKLRQELETRLAPMSVPTEAQLKARVR